MKCLVLGGNGFIGSHLAEKLCNTGHDVRIFDRAPAKGKLGCENILGDFTNTFSIAEALTGIDVVYHLISTTVPSTSNLDIEKDIQTNLIATTGLLQTMIDVGVNKIVYFSSGGTIYGNPNVNPIPETHSLNPICSYGIVKAAIEKYIFLFHKLYGLEYNILRVSNPYGSNQQHFGVQGVIPTFLLKALREESIQVWGDGTIERDYININDLISVSISAGQKMHNDVFNIGSESLTSINQVISTIENITGKKMNIERHPSRNFDVKSISLDCTRAKNVFNWMPEYSLKAGILENWKWLEKNHPQ